VRYRIESRLKPSLRCHVPNFHLPIERGVAYGTHPGQFGKSKESSHRNGNVLHP
jgi:hypothetical protein